MCVMMDVHVLTQYMCSELTGIICGGGGGMPGGGIPGRGI